MKIVSLPDARPRPRAVAVGMFDGVHLGHREVIAGSDTVLTFEPHPSVVLHPGRAPRLLTSLAVKADRIAALGVQELVVISFDDDFAHRSARDFVDDVLVRRLCATRVSVGENFRFGHRATGTPALLAAQDAFETRVVPIVRQHGETISSTRIRQLVAEGDVARAGRLLGAPFELRGEVVRGDRRGRRLGYPTANVVPDPALVLPAAGVYAGRANGHAAAINVGLRPTFDSDLGMLVESYLLDFEGDLYGQELRVEFLERLRDEVRFASVAALVEQMADDVARTREIVAARAGGSATVRRR